MLQRTSPPSQLGAAALAAPGDINDQAILPGYDREAISAGIVHIGVGNFHRVHEAVYIDDCLHLPHHAHWAICGIGLGNSPAAQAKSAALDRQDGLYSVTELAPDGSMDTRVIGALVDYLHAPANPQAALARLADPRTRIVSLTITEGGYNFDEASGQFMLDTPAIAADLAGQAPSTAFGLIVAALARRRAAGVKAFTVLSCDNLRQNGDTARRAVLAFANALDPDLADWIERHASFPNSMVDRIAPTVGAPARRQVAAALGVHDALPALCEPFCQWVLEDDFCNGRPDLAAVGVQFCADVAPYEAVKGRMLNAAHVLLAYPALLCGYRTVSDAMADPALLALLRRFLDADVIPQLAAPAGMVLADYRDLVLERFANPAVVDSLARVASDGAAKIPVFHGATITHLLATHADVRRAALLVACYLRYLDGVDDAGAAFEVSEPHLNAHDRALLASTDAHAALGISALARLRLGSHAGFVAAYDAVRQNMRAHGVKVAIENVISE